MKLWKLLRWLEYLKPNGKVVVNDYKIPSAPILMGKKIIRGVIDIIKSKANTSVINATNIAEELGNMKVMNIVLLGALVKAMDLSDIDWEKAIKDNVKEKFVDINLKAFQRGMEAV